MPHYVIMISMFALAGGFLWWIHHGVVDRVVREKENPAEWRQALLWAGWIMILILLTNAEAFAKMNLIEWEFATEVPGTWRRLFFSHLGVLVGTGSLMCLVVRALQDPSVLEETAPLLGTSRAMVVVAEKLLPRFWWAALGLGTLFGCTGGSGPIIVLAIDLTLFWAAGRVSLAIQHRQLQRQEDRD